MHTQRIHMLKTMLEEIRDGTWQSTRPAVFDMSTEDWLEEGAVGLHADLVGCALLDPRFNADGFTTNQQGGVEWPFLCAYFEAPVYELEPLFMPDEYEAMPSLVTALERVSSYCHFWVRRTNGFCMVEAPDGSNVGAMLLHKAEWMAQELNNALAAAKGMDDHESLKLWGLED